MRDWKGYLREHLALPPMEDLQEERIIEEIAGQLEDFYREAAERGMSEREAEAYALRKIPDWEELEDELAASRRSHRAGVTGQWFDRSEQVIRSRGRLGGFAADLLQNIGLTLRSARFEPGFWAISILVLGLGIGATTTIFSVVDGVMLRRLPFEDADRLVYFSEGSFQIPRFRDWQEHFTSYSELVGYWVREADYTGGGRPERFNAGLATPGTLPFFHASPAAGRLFVEEDYVWEPQAAVLNHAAWQRHFGGDPDVVGRSISIDGRPVVVVGVLDEDFISPEGIEAREPDLWLPLDLHAADERLQSPNFYVLEVFGRLRPGVSLAGAREEAARLETELAGLNPDVHRRGNGEPRSIVPVPLQSALVEDVEGALLLLLGAVALLLAIACANVANLFLARGTEQVQEIALRAALGAGRVRIVAQLLTQSLVISLIGGMLGVALAFGGVRSFEVLNPGGIPLIERMSVDWRVLGFALLVAVVTGVLFGLVPAWHAARQDTGTALKDTSRSATGARSGMRLRSVLVVAEISLALVLMVGAGLLFNSFLRVHRVDPGFDPSNLIGAELRMDTAHHNEEVRTQFIHGLLDRLHTSPDVGSAAVSLTVPFQIYGSGRSGWYLDEWRTDAGEEREVFTSIMPTTPGYFATLGARLEGRELLASDNGTDPVPVVITEDFSIALFDTPSALGRTFSTADLGGDDVRTTLQVVGIVRGLHHWGLDQGTEGQIYLPWDAFGPRLPWSTVLVRAAGDPASTVNALRETVWSLDADLPVPEVFLLREQIARSLTEPRFYTALLLSFAIVALLLAGAGIYGSMLYAVGRRRREMGIRLALGAEPGRLVRLVLRQGVLLTAVGLLLGLGGAYGVTRFLEGMIFGITTTDVPTYLAGSVLLGLAALAGSLIPAMKAAGTDPVEVMRAE